MTAAALPTGSTLFPTLALLGVLSLATVFDLRSRRVPAWLTAGGIVAGVVSAAVAGPDTLRLCLLGAAAGGLVFLPFSLRGWLGGADALLLAVAGAWHGWRFALWMAWWTSLAGAILAIMVWHHHYHHPTPQRRPFPYVPALLAGAIITLCTQAV